MAKKQQIIFRKKAKSAIEEVSLYIEQKGYPETAGRYAQRMIDFGYSLMVFPDKYAICRHQHYAKYGYHCAIFDGNYVFVYKTSRSQLIIYHIIHCSRIQ